MIKHTLQAFFWVFMAHVIVDALSDVEWLSFLMQAAIFRNIVIVSIVYCAMGRKVRKFSTVGPELLPDGSRFIVKHNHHLLTEETDKSGVTTRTYSTPDARIVSTKTTTTHSSNAGIVLFSTVIAFCVFYLLIA